MWQVSEQLSPLTLIFAFPCRQLPGEKLNECTNVHGDTLWITHIMRHDMNISPVPSVPEFILQYCFIQMLIFQCFIILVIKGTVFPIAPYLMAMYITKHALWWHTHILGTFICLFSSIRQRHWYTLGISVSKTAKIFGDIILVLSQTHTRVSTAFPDNPYLFKLIIFIP